LFEKHLDRFLFRVGFAEDFAIEDDDGVAGKTWSFG
jgi:hypothetical protein